MPKNMTKHTLRSTSPIIPQLGIGTFKLFRPEVHSILSHALKEHFINKQGSFLMPHTSLPLHIDTANIYKNEKFIGEELRNFHAADADESSATTTETLERRKRLFIVSKIPPRHMRNPAESVRSVVLKSLEELGISYIDLYLIHWPARDKKPPTDEIHAQVRKQTWIELEKLHKEGKIHHIGVSNYGVSHLKEMDEYATIKPITNQFELHPYLQQRELTSYCREKGITITAYSPLGSASGVTRILEDETIQKIAKEVGRTPAQVVLRWHLQHGHVVIPRTTKVERLEENRKIFDFELSEEQMMQIDSININERMCWDPSKIK